MRKAALVKEIFKCQKIITETAIQHDLTPYEVEMWFHDAEARNEIALRDNPLYVEKQYEQKLKQVHVAYGEGMLELNARE